MKESGFQKSVKDEIENGFPGSIVIKTDPSLKNGIPDLIILYEDKWAALEVKRSKNAPHRPGQDYYIHRMNKMSFASFVYPENRKEVLNELQRSFESKRNARRLLG